jgi:hypothetical protein
MKLFSGLLAAALLFLAVPVGAQSLGELAKREAERRKTVTPPAKTYTNEDLKHVDPPSPSAAATVPADQAVKPAGGDAKAGDSADKTKAGDAAKTDEPAKDETYWHGRITAAREELRRNEAFRDALQSSINGLSADFAARDDPNQRAVIADNRQKALAELARVTQEIEKGNKSIADIEEEARKAGVPPGWVR